MLPGRELIGVIAQTLSDKVAPGKYMGPELIIKATITIDELRYWLDPIQL